MSLPLVVMPDVPKVALDYLRTIPEVTTLTPRISTQSPATPVYPYVTVQRVGGNEVVEFRLDRANLQLDAWGTNEAEASLVIRTVIAALKAARGYQHPTAVIAAAELVLSPQWIPDTTRTPPTPRFVASVALTVHPIP